MKYNEELISVIVPVYNVAPYLEKCLNSILHNTYQNLEVICVNDGSTDDSLHILQQVALTDARVNIISQSNQGLSAARNTGLSLAQGEYIAILDSDDWIQEDYFEILLSALQTQGADMAICNCRKVFPGDRVVSEKKDYSVRSIQCWEIYTIFSRTMSERYAVWNRLYRHDLIGDLRFDPAKKNEDEIFILELMCRHPELKMVYVNAPLYNYLQREGSLARKQSREDFLIFAEDDEVYYHRHQNPEFKNQVAIEIVKRALSLRYYFRLRRDKDRVKRCNTLLYTYVFEIKQQKLLMFLFMLFPELYRQFRLWNDNTLRDYEKQIMDNLNQKREC